MSFNLEVKRIKLELMDRTLVIENAEHGVSLVEENVNAGCTSPKCGTFAEAWFVPPNAVVDDDNEQDPEPTLQGTVLIVDSANNMFTGLWCWTAADFTDAGLRLDAPKHDKCKVTTDAASDFEPDQLRVVDNYTNATNMVYLINDNCHMDTELLVADLVDVAISIDASKLLSSREFRSGVRSNTIPGYVLRVSTKLATTSRTTQSTVTTLLEEFILGWPLDCTDRAWWMHPNTIVQFIKNISRALP